MSSSLAPASAVKVNIGPPAGLGAQVIVTKRQTSLSPISTAAVSDNGGPKVVISRSADQNSSLPVVRLKTTPRIVSTTLGVAQIRKSVSRVPAEAVKAGSPTSDIAPTLTLANSVTSAPERRVTSSAAIESKDDGCDTESSGSPDDGPDGGKRSHRKQTFPPKSPTRSSSLAHNPAPIVRRGQPRIIRLDCSRGVLEEEAPEYQGSSAPVLSPAVNNDEDGSVQPRKEGGVGHVIRRLVITRPKPPPPLDDQTQQRVLNHIPSPPPPSDSRANKPLKLVLDLSKNGAWSATHEAPEVGTEQTIDGQEEVERKKRPYKRRFHSLTPTQAQTSADDMKKEIKKRRRRTKLEMEEARRAIFAKTYLKKNAGRPPLERAPLEWAHVQKTVLAPDESCEMLKDCVMTTGSRQIPCWHEQINSKIFKTKGFPRSAHEVAQWGIDKVADFISSLPYMSHLGDRNVGGRFADQLVDGEALLLLTQDDLVNKLAVKLGPAVKLQNMLLYLKHRSEY